MGEYNSAGIYLEKEEKNRVDTFLIHVDYLFWSTLTKKQRKIYDAYRALEIFSDYGMTISGYMEFIHASKELIVLTGIPFSLEADYAGLGSWGAWDAIITNAFEIAKCKKKRKNKKSRQ